MPPLDDLIAAIKARDVERALSLLKAHPSLAGARMPAGPPPFPGAPPPEGMPLLQLALYARLPRLADSMLAAGAPVDAGVAAMLGDAERLRGMARSDPELARRTSADGFPLLSLAAHYGRLDAMRVLLELGADARALAPPPLGNTALHAACAGAQADAVKLLLAAGAPVDARDASGYTPLMVAAANGAADCVRALLAAGADATLRSNDGKSAREHAAARGHEGVVSLLS